MGCARVFLVGTDTSVGKTAIACALLEHAQALELRVVPYKPVQSSAPDEPLTDAQRLCSSCAPLRLRVDDICPLRYHAPLAPGIADDPAAFVGDGQAVDPAPLLRCRSALEQLIAATDPRVVLIEGAGGLWVPMPGGSWQPAWIRELATHVIVVGRAGLGAINAAVLTIDALRELDLAPHGFYLCETEPADPSNALNAAVISRARALPHLGTLRHGVAGEDNLLGALLEQLER